MPNRRPIDPKGPVRIDPAVVAAPRALHSTDVDEHARHLAGWQQAYAQLSPGRFEGDVLHAALGTMVLVAERTNQRLRERFTVPAGEVVLAVPVALSGPAHWGDARLDADSVAVCRGGESTELLTPREFEVVGFAFREPGPQCAGLPPGRPRVVRDPAVAAAARTLFAGALLALGRAVGHADQARAGRALAGQAADLADRVAAAAVEPASRLPGLARRLALVRRAEAFVEEHADAAPTVADLCRATGACRRTLQASFDDVLGIGPSRYLRALRMNRARADLKRGEGTISDAAVRWGFWHFGRFASDYRAMFGERPSDTLRRAQQGPARAAPGGATAPADFG